MRLTRAERVRRTTELIVQLFHTSVDAGRPATMRELANSVGSVLGHRVGLSTVCAALKRAHVTVRPQRKRTLLERIGEDGLEKMLARLEAGDPMKAVASDLGCSTESVSHWARWAREARKAA